MEAHHENASLDDLEIDGVAVQVYGWKKDIHYPMTAKMLGLEEGVLHLGFYLWEGFPEDKKSIRELIHMRMEFLENIPVGVDLSNVCPEFIVWRLENADFGILNHPADQQIKDLLLEITEVFYQDSLDMQILGQKVQLAQQTVKDQIRALWQKEQKTDPDAYRTLQALEMAAAACTAGQNPAGAADTARIYLFGTSASHPNPDEETDIMSDKLLQLLRSALGGNQTITPPSPRF